MESVSVSELRQNLPEYLARVRDGEEIAVTIHGRTVARLVAAVDRRAVAREFFRKLRRKGTRIGDILSPSEERWEADR